MGFRCRAFCLHWKFRLPWVGKIVFLVRHHILKVDSNLPGCHIVYFFTFPSVSNWFHGDASAVKPGGIPKSTITISVGGFRQVPQLSFGFQRFLCGEAGTVIFYLDIKLLPGP